MSLDESHQPVTAALKKIYGTLVGLGLREHIILAKDHDNQTVSYSGSEGWEANLSLEDLEAIFDFESPTPAVKLNGADLTVKDLVNESGVVGRLLWSAQGPSPDVGPWSEGFGYLLENARLKGYLLELSEQVNLLEGWQLNVLNHVPCGIITTDCRGLVTTFNRKASYILGYDYREVLGKQWFKVIRLESEMRQLLQTTYNTGKTHYIPQATMQTWDGKLVTIEISTALLKNLKGEKAGVVAIFNLLDQKRLAQSEHERMQRLSAVGQFAAGLAHEIRNPLTAVSGMLQLLLEENPTVTPEEVAVRSLKAIGRTDRILEFLLDFSRPRIRHLEFVRASDMVSEAVGLVEYHLKQKNLEVVFYKQDPVPVYCDRGQLEQVLINLLLNSIRASAFGGVLDIKIWSSHDCISSVLANQEIHWKGRRAFEFQADPSLASTVIELSDQGVGIEREDFQRIFEAFYSSSQSGMGLGLSVSLQIIEAHEGLMGVRSDKGQGATFYVVLPHLLAPTPK